jgi:nucleotide-binding universal stress UspA family protein
MPFHRVLVPIDLSDENRRAVEIATEVVSLHADGLMVLLHVIEKIDDEPEDEAGDFYRPIEESARKLMEALVDGLPRKPPTIERRVAYGRRLAETLATAAECRADLIVARSHRIEPNRAGGRLGTLSHEIALLADVPVLLVK